MRTHVYKQQILSHFGQYHLLSITDLEQLIPEADYSTLFRNVKALTESGDLKQVTIGKNKVLYEKYDHNHDHLVCIDCGTVETVHLPRPENTGFKVQEIVARGACTDCHTKTL